MKAREAFVIAVQRGVRVVAFGLGLALMPLTLFAQIRPPRIAISLSTTGLTVSAHYPTGSMPMSSELFYRYYSGAPSNGRFSSQPGNCSKADSMCTFEVTTAELQDAEAVDYYVDPGTKGYLVSVDLSAFKQLLDLSTKYPACQQQVRDDETKLATQSGTITALQNRVDALSGNYPTKIYPDGHSQVGNKFVVRFYTDKPAVVQATIKGPNASVKTVLSDPKTGLVTIDGLGQGSYTVDAQTDVPDPKLVKTVSSSEYPQHLAFLIAPPARKWH